MTTPTPTPATDGFIKSFGETMPTYNAWRDFTRELEQQLAAKTLEVGNLLTQVQAYRDAAIPNPLNRSESLALTWMNRALNAEKELAAYNNLPHRKGQTQ